MIADSVGRKVSNTIKIVEKNCLDANRIFCDSVKLGKKDIQVAVDEQRKAIFTTWSNILIFIFLGAMITFLGAVGFNFFKIQNNFYKELVEQKKIESIQKQAIKEYQNSMLEDNAHKELDRFVKKYNEKRK